MKTRAASDTLQLFKQEPTLTHEMDAFYRATINQRSFGASKEIQEPSQRGLHPATKNSSFPRYDHHIYVNEKQDGKQPHVSILRDVEYSDDSQHFVPETQKHHSLQIYRARCCGFYCCRRDVSISQVHRLWYTREACGEPDRRECPLCEFPSPLCENCSVADANENGWLCTIPVFLRPMRKPNNNNCIFTCIGRIFKSFADFPYVAFIVKFYHSQ